MAAQLLLCQWLERAETAEGSHWVGVRTSLADAAQTLATPRGPLAVPCFAGCPVKQGSPPLVTELSVDRVRQPCGARIGHVTPTLVDGEQGVLFHACCGHPPGRVRARGPHAESKVPGEKHQSTWWLSRGFNATRRFLESRHVSPCSGGWRLVQESSPAPWR